MSLIEAIVLAIIEGLTEFLPVSSTGHMILASTAFGIAEDPFVKMFTISIQFGAILSILTLYFKRFIRSFSIYLKLFIGFIPAAILGLIFSNDIDLLLENALVVAIALVAGGGVLIFVDRWFKKNENSSKEITYQSSFVIGLFQVIAMIPGVSRSAATIVGGLTQKHNRKTAAEFSFLLAVPTMAAATLYSLAIKNWEVNGESVKGFELLSASSHNLILFLLGTIVSFIVAIAAVKTFIAYLTRYGFRFFGYYRIGLGLIILLLYALGYNLTIV